MNLRDAFVWMDENFPGGTFLRESLYGFGFSLTAHVLAMCLFLGLIVVMDLRLVGLAHLKTPPAEIQKRLFPWQMLGFVLVTITGLILFYAQPLRYYGKGFFWLKMALMVLAGVNALVIHRITHRSEAAWNSRAAKLAGLFSLILWTAIVCSGRLVAYSWWTYQ
jgi:hypothetical protein